MLAYIRVSRVGERAGTEGYDSPGDQRRAIERWAEYKNARIVGEYVDEDQSCGTQERPGLEAAIERTLRGEVDGIACYDISRFSRVTEGGLRDLRRLKDRQPAPARLVFATQDIDTATIHGEMIFTILLAVYTAELAEKKARWLVTKARAIGQGRQIGPTPVGYTRTVFRNGRPRGSLAPEPETAPAITAAFKAVAKAKDVRAALPILEEAIPTKTFTARKRDVAERYGVKQGEEVTVPATWNTTTVRRLLRSRVYLGEAFYGNGTITKNPNAHPPLIDGTTWRVVKRVLDAEEGEAPERQPAAAFPLSGLATCATCGRGMTGNRLGSEGRRGYRCVHNQLVAVKRGELDRCARPATISADPLEQRVRELLLEEARAFEAAMQQEDVPRHGHKPGDGPAFAIDAEDLPAELEPLQAALSEAEKQLAAIEAMAMPEAAKAAALEAQDHAVTEAREDLEEARAALEGEADAGYPEPWEIEQAPVERLGELLSGARVVVQPGRGRVTERVQLVRAQ